MRYFILPFFIAGMLCLLPLGANESNTTAQAKQKIISFNFTTVEGKKIEIVETKNGLKFPTLKDKNIITMFYIYTGRPCRNELKLFTKIKTKHLDLEFVTFELNGLSPEKFKNFQKELDLKDLHMIDKEQALPFANYITNRTKWKGPVPLLMITDKNGTLKHIQLGAMSEEEIEALLKKI